MKYQRLILALILVGLMTGVGSSANVIHGLQQYFQGIVQQIAPETGDDSVTVRDDSVWIVLNDSTRISFVVGYAPGSARLQGGVNKVIEFAFDSVFIDVDSNSANPMILFGNFGGGLRWNRSTDKIQFNNDLTGGWSDIGTSSGISEADYNTLIKNGIELKNKIDSTAVHIPVSDSAAGGADRAESAQGLTGYSLNGTDKPADGEVLTYYSDQDSLGWTAGGGGGLTEEQVEDYVGTMVDGGTETRIEVTYTDGGDGAGLLNFVVDDMNDGDAAESEIHDSLDAHWTDFTTLDLDEIGNPSGDHTFAMANKDLKFTWTVGGGYDGGLELEATGNYSDEDLMHIHFHTGDVGDIDLLHIESSDPDVTALHTMVPQDADTNAYFDNGVVFIDRADIDSLDIDGDVIVDLTGANLSVASNILNVDSEPWDSVAAWANLVNDDRDSVLAFSLIVNEAKDSLTSWANKVNTHEDWGDHSGEGYITATLTEEEVEDFVGGMLGGTNTRITITYQDGTNDIDFAVDDMNDDVPDAGDFGNATDLDANGALNTGSVADNEIDYANVTLTDFDYQTAFRVFYSNTDGDVTELALGADGTYLRSNGASANPTFATPGGSGDVTDVIGGTGLTDDGNTGAITLDHDAHSGDVTGATALTIGADKVLESHLKVVNAATDEDIFTYESTTGDFAWHTPYELNIRRIGDTLSKSFVILDPSDANDFPFWQTKRAITIINVSAISTAGTNVIGALDEYNAYGTSVDAAVDGDWTITTSEYTDASFTNAGIDAGDWLGWHTTSVSGSVTAFSITFEYVETY